MLGHFPLEIGLLSVAGIGENIEWRQSIISQIADGGALTSILRLIGVLVNMISVGKKLVYRIIFDQFATFSIFGLFFIKGADDQDREVGSFRNHFQSISHVKIGLKDDFSPIWNIFNFQTLFFTETDEQEREVGSF